MADTSPSTHRAEDVSSFGYKQEMKRDLGWYTSFAVAFGFVSIATGIFTTFSSVLGTSGLAGIWAWPIGVIGQLCVALIFGALAARIPISGYAYQWTSRLANPTIGWAMGWVSFSFLAVVVLAVDYTIADAILPNLLGYTATTQISWAITAGVLLCQGLLVGTSTHATQKVNNVAVTIQLIGMCSLTVLLFIVGIASGKIDFSLPFTTTPIPAEGYFSLGTATHAGPFALAFLLVSFTIVGFESAANLAEETRDPARTVPRAMWQAVLSLGVLGFLFLFAVASCAEDPEALAQSATPVADVITNILGPVVGKLLLVMVVISIFSCGLVITLSGTRLIWAMSRDERFPGWQVLKKIHPRTTTPRNATIFFFLVAQCELAIFSQSTDVMFTLFSAGTLLPAMIYAGTVLLYIVKRKQLPPSKGFSLGRFEMPVIILAIIWLAFELAIFRDTSFKDLWLYILIMFAIGAVYFIYLRVTRGKDGLSMPDMEDIDRKLDGKDA